MKKVLVLAHDFPGGGGRNFQLINHLFQHGYHPLVITTRQSGPCPEFAGHCRVIPTFCIHKTPFRIFSRLFHSWELKEYWEKLFFIPDLYANWIPAALVKGMRLIKEEGIEAVVTISPPESVHLTGFLLSRLAGVRWIADFEDLWTTKKVVYTPPTRFHDALTRQLEALVYREADHIVANTPPNREIYLRDFNIPAEKVTVVTLGFDREDLEGMGEIPSAEEGAVFTIGYLGNFDKKGFPWQSFLLLARDLMRDNPGMELRVKICGNVSPTTQAFIAEQHLEDMVCYCGELEHGQAVRIIAQSDVLLLLMYETGYSKAIVPHKLYHYFGMRKPILAIAEEDGEVARMITSTRTGEVISLAREQTIRDALLAYYREWKREGGISYRPDPEEVEKYDISVQSGRLAGVLDRCLACR